MLFSREDFFKDLEFFNMKAISDKTFNRLKDYVGDPMFVPDRVKKAVLLRCLFVFGSALYTTFV